MIWAQRSALPPGGNRRYCRTVAGEECVALIDRLASSVDELFRATLQLSEIAGTSNFSDCLESVQLLGAECADSRKQLHRHQHEAHRKDR